MHNFTRWVTTPENRSAFLAVQRVLECVCSTHRRREANPLYLHGPAGMGKTHLVHALAGEVSRRCPDRTVAVLPARELDPVVQFADNNDFADQAGEEADLLVLEDMQHLHTRAAEVLVQRLDRRKARQLPLVCTALVGPRQLELPARLTSRLASGLVVGLQALGRASRLAFLQDRVQRRQLAVSTEVLTWLADHTGGSGRQLEGAITRLEPLVRTQHQLPDVDTVAQHFQIEAEASRLTVERITERVSRYFRVEPRQLQSRQRSRNALVPRQIGMYLTRQLTAMSLEQIGAYFGGRDHSTVLHACRKIDLALTHDATLSGAVRQLQADLG